MPQWLVSIPPVFWGIIAGTVFTVIATAINNFGAMALLNRRLKHEEDIRDKDRVLESKKEILLEAAESLSSQNRVIAGFANLDTDRQSILSNLNSGGPATSKVHLIGNIETIRAIEDLNIERMQSLFKLLPARIQLENSMSHLQFLNDRIISSQKEQDRILELMKQYNISGENNPGKWQVLETMASDEMNNHRELIEERDRIQASLNEQHREFFETCMSEHFAVSEYQVPLLLKAREELEMPLEEGSYRDIADNNRKKSDEILANFLDDAKRITSNNDDTEEKTN